MTGNPVPVTQKQHHHRKSSKKEAVPESENGAPRSCSKKGQEPVFLWPPRSLERRRIFQDLYSSFYHQVLSGCGEIRCTNPTCATFRNRISNGPFRPYTALSARALASHLAAQDHPSRRLCPSLKNKLKGGAHTGGSLRLPRDPSKDSNDVRKASQGVQSFDGHRTGDQAYTSNGRSTNSPAKNSEGLDEDNLQESSNNKSKPISTQIDWLKRRAEQNDPPLEDEEDSHPHSSSVAERKSKSFKAKDHKSMAQNLFDSVPLALLQFARLPYIWGISDDEHLQEDGGTREGQQVPLDSQGSGAQETRKGATAVKASHVHRLLKPPEFAQQPPKVDVPDESVPPANAHLDRGVIRSRDSDRIERGLLVDRAHFKMLKSHCEFLECADSQSSSKIFALPRQLIHPACLPLRPHSLLRLGSPPRRRIPCPCELSLTEAKHEQYHNELLRHLGRNKGPSPCVGPKKRQYAKPKALGSSSRIKATCDLLWSSDHLVKVFLSKSDVQEGLVVFGSLDFADLMTKFDYGCAETSFPKHIFTDLWQALGCFHASLSSLKSLQRSVSYKSAPAPPAEYYGVTEIVHISRIVLAALCAYCQLPDDRVWIAARTLRRRGYVRFRQNPDQRHAKSAASDKVAADLTRLMELLNDDDALSLLRRFTRAICGYGLFAIFLSRVEPGFQDDSMQVDILQLVVRSIWEPNAILVTQKETSQRLTLKGALLWKFDPAAAFGPPDEDRRSHGAPAVVVEWLYGILLRDWNGEALVPTMSTVAGALRMLQVLYRYYGSEFLGDETFEASFISDRLDLLKTPIDWLNDESDGTTTHMLDYPFLFKPSILVSYFRSINVARMWKASQKGIANAQLADRLISEHADFVRNSTSPWSKLFEHYLVLEIRRETALTDAMNQLWRRRRCELIRPLKVRIGHGQGEDGVDHGGVQQEFFRIAIAEALDPKYGAFTTDPETHMSWFQPGSLEPLYKFELLGILTSLAIYNGVTLPFTFPIALYMKIMNYDPYRIEHIADGWPELARGLRALRDWDVKDGDVEDVFCRTYEFSVDVFGSTKTTGLHPRTPERPENTSPGASPQSSRSATPSEGTRMVTNANRHHYIRDYIIHLTTTSIEPQFSAFVRGFKTVIDPRSLKLFHTSALQALVQGIPHIDTHELEAVAKYEAGYTASDTIIEDFWYTLHAWSDSLTPAFTKVDENRSKRYLVPDPEGPDKVRRLLEFVTASDRLPVGGAGQVVFVVQKNGRGDELLPTSHTCFGRLLLPVYSGHEIMVEKLTKAVENAQGFGQP